jgi:hypothetical protein
MYSHHTVHVGSALARFELLTLPEYRGKRVVVLRIMKFLTPVTCIIPDYDGWVAFPKEGEILYRHELGRHSVPFSHSLDDDTSTSEALHHLVADYLASTTTSSAVV